MANNKSIFISFLLTTLTGVCLSQPDFIFTLPTNTDFLTNTVVDVDFAEDRIVGGQEANKNEFPGIVHLRITKNNGVFICAGNILSANWILTAAHCVFPFSDVKTISVTAGDHYRNEEDPTEQIRDMISIIVPGSYNSATFAYDIALVELASPFNINEYVQPTILANPNYVPTQTEQGVIAGWGRTSTTGSLPNELRKADVNFVSNDICQRNFAVEIIPSMVCASAPNRGMCGGDAGGPLMVRSPMISNLRFLAGMVNFMDTIGCGDDLLPDVFQRVSSHVFWIMGFVDNLQIYPDESTTTTKRTTTLKTTTTTERTTTLKTTPKTTTTEWTIIESTQLTPSGVERTSANISPLLLIVVLLTYRIFIG